MCSMRVGPGTEPRGALASKAWAKEEARQCCAVMAGVTVRRRRGGRGNSGKTSGCHAVDIRAQESSRGSGVKAGDSEKGIDGWGEVLWSCGTRGHSLRQEYVWRGRPVGAGAFRWWPDVEGLLAAHLSTCYKVGLSSA